MLFYYNDNQVLNNLLFNGKQRSCKGFGLRYE